MRRSLSPKALLMIKLEKGRGRCGYVLKNSLSSRPSLSWGGKYTITLISTAEGKERE